MGWRDILRADDPSSAAYHAVMASPTGRTAAGAIEKAMGYVGQGVNAIGAVGNVLNAPARAISAIGTNAAGTQAPVSVMDSALYGRDMNTGRKPISYGDLLAGTLEDSGEIKPGGIASKILAVAGNTITDPMAAPGVLSAAEGAGALAGRYAPAPVPGPTMTQPMPRSRLAPGSAPAPAPTAAEGPGSLGSFSHADMLDMTPDPDVTQPVRTARPKPGYAGAPEGGFDPGATQPVMTRTPRPKVSSGRIARAEGVATEETSQQAGVKTRRPPARKKRKED